MQQEKVPQLVSLSNGLFGGRGDPGNVLLIPAQECFCLGEAGNSSS